MITFLTGAPGGGKTLFVVSKLLKKLIGTVVHEAQDDGTAIEHKRIIYSNIRGLLLDHELIDAEQLKTWHEWAQPGAVIVFDEVQKVWDPRPNGSKKPMHVEALEEHRGKYSVDFIIISQHPMLVDRNVQNLVGRHLHLRRMGVLPLSLCYEWDLISRTLAFKNAVSKGFVWFDRSAYKLYKSARVHTSQPKKLPGLIWVILLALGLAAWKIPESFSRITGKNEAARLAAEQHGTAKPPTGSQQPSVAGMGGTSQQAAPNYVQTAAEYTASYQPRTYGLAHTAPRYDAVQAVKQAPKPAACVDGIKPGTKARVCQCWTQQATILQVPADMCRQFAASGYFDDTLDVQQPSQAQPPRVASAPAHPQPVEPVPASFDTGSVLPAMEAKSTISRDAEVLSYLAKRKQIN